MQESEEQERCKRLALAAELLAKKIRDKYFSEFKSERIEGKNKASLIARVEAIYPCLATEELEAIARLGLYLNTSNSVSDKIIRLSRDELRGRKA